MIARATRLATHSSNLLFNASPRPQTLLEGYGLVDGFLIDLKILGTRPTRRSA
jgi:hypothetical protein